MSGASSFSTPHPQVIEDIKREMPSRTRPTSSPLGGDVRFAASRLSGSEESRSSVRFFRRPTSWPFARRSRPLRRRDRRPLPPAARGCRDARSCSDSPTRDSGGLVGQGNHRPRCLAGAGMLLDMSRGDEGVGIEDFSRQVLASAAALGENIATTPPMPRTSRGSPCVLRGVASEHGLERRDRLLLESRRFCRHRDLHQSRALHKHSHTSCRSPRSSDRREDTEIVANVARYHRRATP